jgi:AcrR family transcriptional regulator
VPKIVDKKEKADAIATTAMEVFQNKGFSRTRMADIAARADIGKGTIYEYFENKADILRYAIERYFATFSQDIGAAVEGKREPADKILSLIEFALKAISEWEIYCTIYIDYFSAIRTAEVPFSLSPQYELMKRIIIQLIEECQSMDTIDTAFDPAAVAELLVSIYDGVIVHRLLEGRNVKLELVQETLMTLIRRGLFKTDSQSSP